MCPKDCAYIVEHLSVRFMAMVADHSRQLTEHRAAFGARTEADAKIIAGLREESAKYKAERDHFYQREGIEKKRRMDAESERDALRAEVAALQERLRSSTARGDFAQMEVAALKSQNPKQHPVKVGEWIVRTAAGAQLTPIGTVAQVVSVADGLPDGYEYVIAGGRWHSDYCEPCDQPATHDTEAGKAVAESAVSETVADEIKVGDVVKVVGASGDLTAQSDIGKIGEVLKIDFGDGTVRLSGAAGWVDQCDVRKVTT